MSRKKCFKGKICNSTTKYSPSESQKTLARFNRTKPVSNADRQNKVEHVSFLKGFDLDAFEQYEKEIWHAAKAPRITLDCFDSKLSKEKKLKRGYDRLLKHHQWRCNPQNWKLLRNVIEKNFLENFPNNPQKKFGILSDFNAKDLEKQIVVLQKYQLANFDVNVHSHKILLPTSYVKTVAAAPKVKLFELDNKKLGKKTEVVAMSVDGEILVGQICTTKRTDFANGIDEESCSAVSFSIFYQGDPSVVMDICDDHYKQITIHKNKISKGFHFLENGEIEPKTKFSHRHWYDSTQIAFTRVSASVNVEPMPINQNNLSTEKLYNSFDDMTNDSKKSLNYAGKTIPEYKLCMSKKQKKLIESYVENVESPHGTKLCNKEIDECIQKYLEEEKLMFSKTNEREDDLTGTIFDPNFVPLFEKNAVEGLPDREV